MSTSWPPSSQAAILRVLQLRNLKMITPPREILPFKYNILLTILNPKRGLSFRTSASEGAILTMPDGAISQDLENIPRFREYAAANVRRWYKYINGLRGREAKNGDVR